MWEKKTSPENFLLQHHSYPLGTGVIRVFACMEKRLDHLLNKLHYFTHNNPVCSQLFTTNFPKAFIAALKSLGGSVTYEPPPLCKNMLYGPLIIILMVITTKRQYMSVLLYNPKCICSVEGE